MRLAVLFVVPAILAGLERLAAPRAELADPVWQRHDPASEMVVDQGPWADFLAQHLTVRDGGANRLDYAGVTPGDRAALSTHVDRLEAVEVTALSRPAQLAYWINLYNAATVELVLAHYPLDSIRDIGSGLLEDGPWSREVVTVMGLELTLDDIEHGIIRPVFEEPRIHYAVNCAALGCPDLAPEPWDAATLEADLAAAERAFVNDRRGVRLEDGELVLSKIWLWFRGDFADSEAELLSRLREVATGPAAEALAGRDRADRHAYDWALNDLR